MDLSRCGVLSGGRLLAVDDSALHRTKLTRELIALGHEVEGAENGRQALDLLAAKPFDLMLLDLKMPEMDGHAVLEELRRRDLLRELPVIVISGTEDVAVAAHCIELGAEDYLTKPFDTILLRARVNSSLEKKRLRDLEAEHLRELTELRGHLEERNADLTRANEMLAEMAFTDSLTRLPNRRFALQNLDQMWELFRRRRRPFSCVLCDVDYFKKINDTFGHDWGDRVLIGVAERLKTMARGADIVCRFGGEEFLVLCPETELEGAVQLAERLRQGVEAIEFKELERTITATFGVGQVLPGMERAGLVLKTADDALYQAKEAGRNRVGIAAAAS